MPEIESESELAKDLRWRIISWVFEPKATIALIIANIVLFIASYLIFSEKTITSLLFTKQAIFTFSIITSMFMHANLLHLLGNMLFLFIFGRVVEKEFGSGKMLIFYFLAGIIATVSQSLFISKDTYLLGASGAIAGLIAAGILINPFYITYLVYIIPIPIIIIGWLKIVTDLLGILSPVQDGIARFAHLGGYLSITLALFFFSGERDKLLKGLLINIIALVIVGVLYFLFFADLNLFLQSTQQFTRVKGFL